MKNNIFKLIMALASILFLIGGCQSPEELIPSVSRDGINSITASFMGDDSSENSFSSEIDHNNGIITIVFPYNYPRTSNNVLTLADLDHMRVSANLDDNVTISPALLYMDLTKDNLITITDQTKTKKQYKVVAEIRKSAESAITSFELIGPGLVGVVNEENKTISIIAVDEIGPTLAKVSLSHGATMSPDPREVELDYNEEVKITVTAQNGTSTSVYTVKKDVPAKVEIGMREGSGKVLWAKKLQSDLGIVPLNLTGGLAVTKDHVVINTRGEESIYLNRKTGEKEGTLNMSSIVGSLTNFYNTADDDGNIFVNNLAPNAGSFKIWRIKDVTSTPELYIEYNGGEALGRKISIKGSVDKDAIITAPIYGEGKHFLRWEVKNGALVSTTPEKLTISGIEGAAWWDNADIVYSNPSDVNSDYFAAYYTPPRKLAWVDGVTHAVKAWGPEISGNWIVNAVDHAMFNNNAYVVQNSINSFTWGSDDTILLFDASSTNSISTPIWNAPIGTYGGKDNAGQNANGTGDVVLKVSDDGYYMHLYFMFTNGQVVCVQFDAIAR
ncbi:MAG: DUF5018 domain-containing protein [Bacteroidales bacterium]|nr:DUF5018 domain-containing protein [Bacteroidales bacterium]